MANPNKRKGTAYETRMVEFLRGALAGAHGVRRPPQAGRFDVGDIHVSSDVVVQCKDWGKWSKASLEGWIRDVGKQAEHAGRTIGVVAVKRRREKGVSSGAAGESLVVMTAATFGELLSGYLDVPVLEETIEEMEMRDD